MIIYGYDITPHLDRFWGKVRKSDTCWEWIAGKSNGYGYFSMMGTMCRSHRIAYELAKGPIPEGLDIDHICHNRACVNPEHLRPATTKQNQENCWRVHTSSGIRGVYRDKKKWRAQVTHEGKSYYNGNHETLAEAEAAVIALRNHLFTHNEHDRPFRNMPADLLATITGKDPK